MIVHIAHISEVKEIRVNGYDLIIERNIYMDSRSDIRFTAEWGGVIGVGRNLDDATIDLVFQLKDEKKI